MGRMVKKYAGILILFIFAAALIGSASFGNGSEAANLINGSPEDMATITRMGVGTMGPGVAIAEAVAIAMAAEEIGSTGMAGRR